MSYTPPPHLAIILTSALAGSREVEFWTEAVRVQLRDHAAPAWGLPPPGVFTYTPDTFIPSQHGAIVALVDDDGNDDAAGLHSVLAGMAYGLVDLKQAREPSRTLSHECLELWANAMLDRWVMGPNGLEYAVELCDAVQRNGYEIPVTIFGETRHVTVSDFVKPRWFEIGGHSNVPTSCNWGETIGNPFQLAPGGYAIARNRIGQIMYLSHAEGADFAARKLGERSRTARLISGR